MNLTPPEGGGNAGRRCTRSRACSVVNTRVSHHESTGTTRHSRTPRFYGLFRALPGDRALLPPSSAELLSHELDTSVGVSGPHDFAVRVSTVRQWPISVHRIPPRVRDDRETPLSWDETGRVLEVISVGREEEYFCAWYWTTQIPLIRLRKILQARTPKLDDHFPFRSRLTSDSPHYPP